MATLRANGVELVRVHAQREGDGLRDEIWISVGDRGWALSKARLHTYVLGEWKQGNAGWHRFRRINLNNLKGDVEAMLRGLTRADWDILSVEWKGLP